MRIISGENRGKKLKAPKGLTTRPVLARVRQALFNLIGDIEKLKVLDLFAGTGAVGIEALSRGAESATFVEIGHSQIRVIKENLSGIGKKGTVYPIDVFRAIKKLKQDNCRFDFIFADPPYDKGLSQKVLTAVAENDIISENGIMALTVRHSEIFPDEVTGLIKIFDRKYGDSKILIYKKNVSGDSSPVN